MWDIGENPEDLPSEDYPKFRKEIVEEVMEKFNQDGLDTLATTEAKFTKEENVVTKIIISEG